MASKKSEFELLLRIVGSMDPSVVNAANMTKRQLQKMKNDIDSADSLLWGGLTKAAKIGVAAIAAAGTATIGLGKQAYQVGSEFEKAMSQWAAVADANVSQYTKAEAAALKWGRQTTKTATESAEALTYMATAGWDVDRSIAALPQVLKLSEAANLDLAHTSDLVTNAMAATGTEAQDLSRLLDVAAKANNRSNQTAEEVLIGWRKVGANLNNLHVDIEESATALGVMANRGKKAQEAGTALNTVLINLTTGQGQAGKMMEKLGLTAFNEDGSFKGLKQTLVELNEATKDLSDEERNAAFAALGGKRQVEALQDLMAGLNHEVREGVSEWDYLQQEFEHADGALQKMASRRMDNLWGDVKILQSALQDTGIRAYKGFAEPMRDAAKIATQAVYDFSENVSDKIGAWYPTIKREMKEAGAGLEDFVKPLMSAGSWIIQNQTGVTSGLIGIAAGITTFHAAWSALKGIGAAGQLFQTLGTTALPLTILGVAAGGIAGLETHMRLLNRQMAKESISKHFGDIALNAEELRRVAKQIVGEKSVEQFTRALQEMQNLKDIGKEVDAAGEAMDRFLLKVNAGLMLNEADIEEFGVAVENMASKSLEAVDQQKFTMRLNVDALFGEGNEQGGLLLESFNQMNSKTHSEVERLGKELGDAYKEAIADGIVEPFEAEKIDELKAQLQKINDEILADQQQGRLNLATGKINLNDLSGESLLNAIDEAAEVRGEQIANISASANETMAAIAAEERKGIITPEQAENQRSWVNREVRNRTRESEINTALPLINTLAGGNWQSNGYATQIAAGYGYGVREMQEEARKRIQYANERGESASSVLNELIMNLPSVGASASQGIENAEDIQAIAKYYEEAEDIFRGVQRIRDEIIAEGGAVPTEVLEAASLVDMLQAVVGDVSTYDQLADVITQTPELMELVDRAKEEGAKFPEGFTDALEKKQKEKEAQQKAVGKQAGESASSGLRDADVDADAAAYADKLTQAIQSAVAARPVQLAVNTYIAQGGTPSMLQRPGAARTGLRNALGGIYYSPIETLVAEGRDAEAIIPINTSARSANLYQRTGEMLRAAGADIGGGAAAYSYAPVITFQINGNADENTIRNAMRQSYEDWLNFAQRYERDRARLAY